MKEFSRTPRFPIGSADRGFTLIELMVAVGVLAIIISIAAPSFRNITLNQRIKAASFDIAASLTFARSEAIKQNGNVTLEPVDDDWAKGWTIKGPDGATLKTQGAFEGLVINGPASLVYGRSGRLASAPGSIEVDDSLSNAEVAPRCISFDVTGLPRSRVGGCS